MMRGVSNWAVAVRKPVPEPADGRVGRGWAAAGEELAPALGEIAVTRFPCGPGRGAGASTGCRSSAASWPWSSRSGSACGRSGSPPTRSCPSAEQEISGGAWFGTVLVSVVFAVGLFFVVPVGLTSLIKHQLGSSVLFWLVEGVLRTSIFLGYLVLLSRVPDLRRVFEYHGAEHKVISCYEADDELTPERAKLLLAPAPPLRHELPADRDDHGDLRVRARSACRPGGSWSSPGSSGVPVIAGLSFEVIKWAGRNRSRRWVQAIMYPGPPAPASDHARARSRPARGVDRRARRGAGGRDARRGHGRRPDRRRSRRLSAAPGAVAPGGRRRCFSRCYQRVAPEQTRNPNKERACLTAR